MARSAEGSKISAVYVRLIGYPLPLVAVLFDPSGWYTLEYFNSLA